MAGWDVRTDAIDHVVSYQPSTDKKIHIVKINNHERFNRLPDAFLFDTDNTLYPYDPAHAAAQQAVREKVAKTFSIFSLKTRGSGTDHIIRANALIIKSNMIAAPQRIRVCGLIFKKELTQIIFELHSVNFRILFDYLHQFPTVLR